MTPSATDPYLDLEPVKQLPIPAAYHLSKRYRGVFVLLLTIVCCALSTLAQTQPQPSDTLGFAPGSTFHKFDVDSINLANRNGVIRIPLFSLSEPGSLALSINATINTNAWQPTTDCTDRTPSCSFYYFTNRSSYGVAQVLLGPTVSIDSSYVVTQNTLTALNQDGSTENETRYVAYDSSGALHNLYHDAANFTKLRSIDGSGLLFTSSSTAPYDFSKAVTSGGYAAGSVYDSGGRRFDTSGMQTDVNGNSLTPSAGTWVDPAGRVIAFPPRPDITAQELTASVTGCPNLSAFGAFQPVFGAKTWTVPGVNGMVSYKFCYANIKIHTNFWNNGGQNVRGEVSPDNCGDPNQIACNFTQTFVETVSNVLVIQSIVLPDNTYWGFVYDAVDPNSASTIGYGTLSKLILPTGGSIAYTYDKSPSCAWPIPTSHYAGNNSWDGLHVKTRTENDGANQYVWQYKSDVINFPNTNALHTTTVTDPNLNDSVHTFANLTGSCSPQQEVENKSYQGSSSSQLVLKDVVTRYQTWSAPQVYYFSDESGPAIQPYDISTSIDGISLSTETFQRSSQGSVVRFDCQLDEAEVNHCGPLNGAAAVPTVVPISDAITSNGETRSRVKSLQSSINSAYYAANLLSIPASEEVDNSSGMVSKTTYTYDESSYLPSGGIKGLPTTVSRWNDSGPSIVTHMAWNAKGLLDHEIDDLGNTSQAYTYGSQYSGIYLTAAVDALGHSNIFEYDLPSGKVTSVTDANQQKTSYTYELGDRPIDVLSPAIVGGVHAETKYCYTVPSASGGLQQIPSGCAGGSQVSVTMSKRQSSSVWSSEEEDADGLGRVVKKAVKTDNSSSVQDFFFDGKDQVVRVSNPYDSGSAFPVLYTETAYDALGRTLIETAPDGSVRQWCWDGTPVNSKQTVCESKADGSVFGTWVDASDESGMRRQTVTDGFGQLREVVERGTASKPLLLITTYTYNALGDLLTAVQAGAPGDVARNRSFNYDSLSRLTSSLNPETGSITYSYLDSSQKQCSGDPFALCSKTDVRGVSTAYAYDAINRLVRKTYSGTNSAASAIAAATPPATYSYDSSSVTNGIGRLSTEYTGPGSAPITVRSIQSYDPVGHVASQSAAAPNATSTASATYDLAGNQVSMTYPDGRSVRQGFDAASRLSSVQYQSWNVSTTNLPQTYFSETNGYDAAGHLVNGSFGNGVPIAAGYDNRERMTSLTYGTASAPLWSKQLAWTPNSNLQSQTDLITGVQRQFAYDNLNRLTAAQDIFSNLAVASGSNGNTGSTSTSGSGAEEAPGQTGAMGQWTNPDDSNLLGDIGETNSGWTSSGATIMLNNIQAPNGAVTATRIAASGSTVPSVTGVVTSTWDYADETMTGSVWLRSLDGSAPTVNLYILANGSSVGYKQITLSGTWHLFQVTTGSPIPNNVTALSFMIGGSTSTATGFFMWNPMLEDEGTAGSSVTNILPYSQNFTAANWSHGALPVTYTPNVGPGPDGTNTATSLAVGGTTGQGGALGYVLNPAPYSQQPITASVYLKAPSGTLAATFALYETGTGATGCNTSVTVTLTANWQRVSAACVSQSALSTLRIAILVNAGSTFQMWGAQMELSSTTGPYVPTASAPATMSTSLTNILPYSQQFDKPGWTLTNGSLARDTSTAPDGSLTSTVATASGGSLSLSALVPNSSLYAGSTVTASVYMRVASGTLTVPMSITSTGSQGTVSTSLSALVNTTWQRFSLTPTSPLQADLSKLNFKVVGGGLTSGNLEIWGAQVEIAPYAGPYIATTDLPVITGSEPTNILPNSQNLSGTNWSMSLGGCSVNVAAAPDGTGTAAICVAQSTATDSYLKASVPNPSLYDGETVTASVYLKANTSTPQTVMLSIPARWVNGSGSGSGAIAQSPQPVTLSSTTWQRFDLTGTVPNGTTYLALQVGGTQSLSAGQSFQVWGAQFAVGSAPAPYDPTTSHTTVYATGQAGTLVPNGLNQAYSYDSFGNILQNGSFESGYTAKNQMTGYLYDAAGNLLSDGINVLAWDAESRMATAAGATYVYDAEGNRVEKQGSTVTDTVYFGGQPIARYAGGQWTDLIYGPTGLLAEVPGQQNATPVYRVTDNLGTNVGSLLSTGAFVEPLDHTPFGQVFTGSTDDPYLFTGKERDTESGLDYFGARYYSSNMGRFSSPDPSGLYYSDPANPQSLNLYSYAQNNPLINVDPTGLDCAYFNDAGDGIESVDKNSNGSECGANGGNWVNGTLTGAQYFSGSDTWGLQSRDSSNSYLTYASAPGTQSDGTTCGGDCDKANGYSQTSLGGVSDIPLNPYALGVIQGVAQQTAWVPDVCGVGLTVRAGLPGSRLSAGVDLSSQNGINGAGGARIAQLGNVQGSVSVKGKSVSVSVTAPIPGTPFVGGISTKGAGVSSVSVGMRAGVVNVQEYANVGTMGTCHHE